MGHGASIAIDRLLADRDRLRDFFLTLRKDVFRIARRRFPWVRDADVEESVQECFVAVLERRGSYTAPPAVLDDPQRFAAHLSAYLRAAAINKIIDRIGRAGPGDPEPIIIEDGEDASDVLDKLMREAGHSSPTPEDNLMHSARMRVLSDCMRKLTVLARQTFELALRGYGDTEIQAHTGAGSAVAVRRRISETKGVLTRCAQSSLGGAT